MLRNRNYELEEDFGDDGYATPRVNKGKPKQLNITSLVDILTILLVFLIKNVNMTTQVLSQPKGLEFPTTLTQEKYDEEKHRTLLVKVYPDKIYVGTDNTPVGTLEQLVNDQTTRSNLKNYLEVEVNAIITANPDMSPLLIIQADYKIPCQIITELVYIAAKAKFSNIYFASQHDSDKISVLSNPSKI
jgi:biopolymer transport protein ExbD